MTSNRQTISVVEALGESEIFGALLEDELEGLARLGMTARYPPNKVIFEKGDPGDRLMVVLQGRIKIRNLSADGKEVVLNFIQPGQTFGEIALLDGKPRTASAITIEPCELFILHRNAAMGFIEQKVLTAIRLIGVLCQKIRRTTEMLEENVLLNMAPRIARCLRRLAIEHGTTTPEGILIDIKLNQSELGAFTGISRENINRQLGAWREGGVISLKQGRILIHKPKELEILGSEIL